MPATLMGGVAGVRVLKKRTGVRVPKKGTDRSVHWSGSSDGCEVVERGQSGQSPFSASSFQFLLEIGEELEGFDRAELIDVEFADAVGQFVIDGFEELDLDGGFLGDEIFVLRQDLAGAFDDAHR